MLSPVTVMLVCSLALVGIVHRSGARRIPQRTFYGEASKQLPEKWSPFDPRADEVSFTTAHALNWAKSAQCVGGGAGWIWPFRL